MDVKLVMFKDNGQRRDFPIVNDVTVIGRSEGCDLRVPIVSASRRHCELTISGGQAKLKDLDSSNGTYVNNKRVEEVELKAGDQLLIGPVVFTVQIDGVPEEIHPAETEVLQESEALGDEAEEVADLQAELPAAALQETVSSGEAVTEQIDPITALESLAEEKQDERDETKQP